MILVINVSYNSISQRFNSSINYSKNESQRKIIFLQCVNYNFQILFMKYGETTIPFCQSIHK